jgi:hypothetical protein
MVDSVVHRHKIRETVARLCRLTMKMPAPNHPSGNGAWQGGNGAAAPLAAEAAAEGTSTAAS